MHRCTDAQMYRCTDAQMHRCTDAHISFRPREALRGALLADLCEVARQLEADADVVLHPPDLPRERDALLLKRVGRELGLVPVDLHLLAEACAHVVLVA